MKGHENLQPARSKDEARTRGKKGGQKSGEARRQKKALRERLELLLAKKGDGEKVVADEICIALIEKAQAGDVRAFEVIRDSIGEKPVEKKEADIHGTMAIKWEA